MAHQPKALESFVTFVLIIGITVGGGAAVGLIVGGFTGDPWYDSLQKPSWNPPNSVFGPVWTMLYILMGLAAFLIWRRGGFFKQALPLSFYTVQLVANFSWTFIFAEAHELLLAFIEICCLWVLIVATAVLFGRVRKISAILLAPYIGWVTFAGVLNFEFWRLNKDGVNATMIHPNGTGNSTGL